MPRMIATDTDQPIELGDLVEKLERDFDGRNEDEFAGWGEQLRRLANNRAFLGDLVVAELKENCAGQSRSSQYGAQVIVLHAARNFLIRANFWPAPDDSVVVNSGTDPFLYHVPHDHNFSFLTVGYVGPGYWSDYYEYDYDRVVGVPGEKVDLRFVERSRLDEGKVMLYRAHRDVHLQLPADAMSVSLNIIALGHGHDFKDQYRFDVERSEIAGIVNHSSLETLLILAAHLGGDPGEELLDSFIARHPSDRIRFTALKAMASKAAVAGDRIAIYEKAARMPNAFVSAMAAREARTVERGRSWIESAPEV